MPNRSKQKGNRAERDWVNIVGGKRAWGSDGRSMGLPEGVDVVGRDGTCYQVKSRKALPKWLQVPNGADAVAIRIDRDGWYLLQRLEDAL